MHPQETVISQVFACTNYVRIANLNGLRFTMSQYQDLIRIETHPHQPDHVRLVPATPDGDFPGTIGERTFDPAQDICPYLAQDQVLLLQRTGARYRQDEHGRRSLVEMIGTAEAYLPSGEMADMSLQNFQREAARSFGIQPDDITPVLSEAIADSPAEVLALGEVEHWAYLQYLEMHRMYAPNRPVDRPGYARQAADLVRAFEKRDSTWLAARLVQSTGYDPVARSCFLKFTGTEVATDPSDRLAQIREFCGESAADAPRERG